MSEYENKQLPERYFSISCVHFIHTQKLIELKSQ